MQPMKLKLVSCTVFDWPELAGLFRATFPDIPDIEISYQLRNHRQDIRLLRVGLELAGFTILLRNKGPGVGWLEQLAVDPKFRGLGYAKLLIDDFEKRARDLGFESVELSAYRENLPAIALYEALGFRLITPPGPKLGFKKTLPESARKRDQARALSTRSQNGLMTRLWRRALYAVIVR